MSPPHPKPLSRRKQEPIGWDFEDVRYREEPIPRTWWFIPWSNTEHCNYHAKLTSTGRPKALYFMSDVLEATYRGSGMIVEEIEGRVIGCYKTHADTEQGELDQHEVEHLKADGASLNLGDADRELSKSRHVSKSVSKNDSKAPLKPLAGLFPNPAHRTLARDSGKPLPLPNLVRRLNGLLLDPRPSKIALHKEDVIFLHPAMAGYLFRDYGEQYPRLEYHIRRAMKDTFNEKTDLPVYRQRDIEMARKAGQPEMVFHDELGTPESSENENGCKRQCAEVEGQNEWIVSQENDRMVLRSANGGLKVSRKASD